MKSYRLAKAIAHALLGPFPVATAAVADPLPPLDHKRPPLVLNAHGIFSAGGQIVNRTQSGSQNAGDLKHVPYNQQRWRVG